MTWSGYRILLGSGLVALASLLVASCLPMIYKAEFPEFLGPRVSVLLEESSEILVYPCWYWIKNSRVALGPPIIVPREELESFPRKLKTWRGVDMVGVFSHEGIDAPLPRSVSLIGDSGRVVRFDYSLASNLSEEERWSVHSSIVGASLKAALLDAFSGEELPAREASALCHDKPSVDDLLGEEDALTQATGFVQALRVE